MELAIGLSARATISEVKISLSIPPSLGNTRSRSPRRIKIGVCTSHIIMLDTRTPSPLAPSFTPSIVLADKEEEINSVIIVNNLIIILP